MENKSQDIASQFNAGDQSPRIVWHQNPIFFKNMAVRGPKLDNNSEFNQKHAAKQTHNQSCRDNFSFSKYQSRNYQENVSQSQSYDSHQYSTKIKSKSGFVIQTDGIDNKIDEKNPSGQTNKLDKRHDMMISFLCWVLIFDNYLTNLF